MNKFLRGLSASEQVGLLFVIVFGLLLLATLVLFALSLHERDSDRGKAIAAEVKRLNGLLQTSWLVVLVFWIGWALGETVATILFAILAFLPCASS
jgi:phosphatidate cytidylyltransferase